MCSSKPTSKIEMLIQDVGLGQRTVFKPNGIGPITEDMTWQLAHKASFSLDGPIKEETQKN